MIVVSKRTLLDSLNRLRIYFTESISANPKMCGIFFVCALADLLSTLLFFSSGNIDHEFHPGIKLFAYAYGRTVGIVLGKAFQVFLAFAISMNAPKLFKPILIIGSIGYLMAGIHNFLTWT
mgnify:CR=1 FL=1